MEVHGRKIAWKEIRTKKEKKPESIKLGHVYISLTVIDRLAEYDLR